MKKHSQCKHRGLPVAVAFFSVLLVSAPVWSTGKPGDQHGPRSYSEASQMPVRPAPAGMDRPPPVSLHARGVLQVFGNQVDFDAAVGDPGALTSENFDGGATGADVFNTCTEPVSSASNDVCFAPGDLVDGFAITSSGGGGVIALGATLLGPAQTTTVLGANNFTSTTIVTFTPAVTAFSADFYGAHDTGGVTVTVLDEDGNVLGSGVADPTAPDAPDFLGAISPVPIGSIVIEAADGGELLDNLRFGAGHGDPILLVQSAGAVVVDQCLSNPAQDNGIVEPGETANITVPVAAIGGDFNNVMADLDLPAPPGVTYVTSSSSLGTISGGTSADAMFSIQVDGGFACPTDFSLGITATGDEGSGAGSVTIDVGAPVSPVPGDVPVPIPDNDPAGASSVINVAQDYLLDELSVRVDIPHTYVSDLIITLSSPEGTSITLLDRPGVPASGFGCKNDNIDATFTDGQPDPEDICDPAGSAAPWPVTTAGPVQPLSSFDGENVQGDWTLTVSDNASQDLGQIVDWELIPTPAFEGICTVCKDANDIIFRDGFEL